MDDIFKGTKINRREGSEDGYALVDIFREPKLLSADLTVLSGIFRIVSQEGFKNISR